MYRYRNHLPGLQLIQHCKPPNKLNKYTCISNLNQLARYYNKNYYQQYGRNFSTFNDSNILIRNGTIVNSDREFIGDVIIGHGKITSVLEHDLIDENIRKVI